jgi:outer membrane protein
MEPTSMKPAPRAPSWIQRHAISLFAALMLSAYAPRAFAQVRIAVVDLQRALQETEDGRRAKARLKRLFKQRQEELDKRQTELKQLSEDLEKQGAVLSAEARQERVESLQKKALELQQLYVQYQRELAEKEAELTSQIIARMEQILRRIGQTENYTLIVERSEGGVVWTPTNLDLTDVVIQRYNSGEGREADGAGGGAAAPAGGGAAPAGGGAARPPAGGGAAGRPRTPTKTGG